MLGYDKSGDRADHKLQEKMRFPKEKKKSESVVMRIRCDCELWAGGEMKVGTHRALPHDTYTYSQIQFKLLLYYYNR